MTSNDDLAHWLSRTALQDRSAFEQLYRATSAHLLGLAHGILQRRDWAEDVLQEAFMNVWYGAGGYNRQLATPMTWLINIVRNKAIDKLRSGKAAREATGTIDDDTLQLPADAALQPERQLDDSLAKAQVDRCMATLTASQRQAIALAYYRGLVHTEIALALGAPLGSVKAWVRRGVDRLRGCLQAAGVDGT
jgi:RNA polymerase sigma-70 factor, ECF subfamily